MQKKNPRYSRTQTITMELFLNTCLNTIDKNVLVQVSKFYYINFEHLDPKCFILKRSRDFS